MREKVVIFGTAEIASLCHFYFKHDSNYQVSAFTVDDEFIQQDSLEGVPIIPFSEIMERFSPEKYMMHVALSYNRLNKLREEKYHQAKSLGYKLVSYVCSKTAAWPDIQIGDNCFILENQTIQPTVKIGNNVMIWSSNHIGHGTHLKSHTYLASHIVLSGHNIIGERCFIGVNVATRDFCKIGDDCFIGMGANITKDVPNGSVVLGQPATILDSEDSRSKAIKKNYLNIE